MHATALPLGRAVLVTGLSVLLSCALAACRPVAGPGAVQASDSVEKSLPTVAAPVVVVDTFNGSIDVVPGVPGTVSATVKRTGEGGTAEEAQADVQKIAVTLEAVGDMVTLKAVYTPSPNHVTGGRGASAVVTVPAGSRLQLETSNGRIGSKGVTGGVSAATSNGGVSLSDVASSVVVHTSNGEVTVHGAATGVTAATSNGPIAVDGATGTVDLRTSSGRIELMGVRSASVTAATSNQEITFEGRLADGTSRFSTSNGPVRIALPADASFAIDARTSNGTATCRFTLSSGDATGTEIHGSVGSSPTVRLSIETSNGDVLVAPSR